MGSLAERIKGYFENKCEIIEIDEDYQGLQDNLENLKPLAASWTLDLKSNGEKIIYFSFNANILPMIFLNDFNNVYGKRELAKRVVKLPQEWDYMVDLVRKLNEQ